MSSAIASTSWVPAPLYACLKKADERLGPNRVWQGTTPEQLEFLACLPVTLADLDLLNEDEFRTMLSEKAEEINAWLKRNGFDIKPDPLEPGQFGTAAIIRLSAEWVAQGTADELKMENGATHPAVFMTDESCTGRE